MDEQEALLKELKLQNKKLQRENRRLTLERDILTDMNEKVSRTQLFFQRDNQRQLCYNSQILKTSPYILVMVNEHLKTVMASDVFFQISGVGRDAVEEGMELKEAFSGILKEEELRFFLERCEGVLNSRGTDSYLLTAGSGAEERYYRVEMCYYSAQNEDAKGISIVLSDMTEIVEAQKKAENADRAKSSFLASMSHEIRTPINAVLGMNEMILREAKDQSILEYSSNIQTAGRTLLYLINSILDFSKIEEGKMEIVPVEYDTASVLHNLVISNLERAEKKDLVLITELDPNLPSRMVGDDVRFSQVVINLLTNAIKYTEKGSVTLQIRSGERKNGEISLQVSVKDTGIGIRKEDIPKLFETFERLDAVRNHGIEGTGLGISIVTKLLQMMGSSLKVDSVYGEGSVFSFELTQGIADETPIGEFAIHMDMIRPEVGGETLSAPDSRILVVDDNEMNLMVAKNLFGLFDITPDLADSGMKAIELLRSGKSYHMIFLDHMMPKMDGIETLKLIKEEKLLSESTTLIALTANAVKGAKERYLEAGFDGYLSKPIEVGKLEEMLAHNLPSELCGSRTVKEEAEGPSDTVARLAEMGLDTEAGLVFSARDPGFYLELVSKFANSCARNLPQIRSDYLNEDWKDYEVRVHALKSTAKQIGAKELSEMALKQEMAAESGDMETIHAHAQELFFRYEEFCDRLKEVLRLSEAELPPEFNDITSDSFNGILLAAKEKTAGCEAEEALELLKPLSVLPEDRLKDVLPEQVSCTDFSEALGSILEVLEYYDVVTAEERLDELMKHFPGS